MIDELGYIEAFVSENIYPEHKDSLVDAKFTYNSTIRTLQEKSWAYVKLPESILISRVHVTTILPIDLKGSG